MIKYFICTFLLGCSFSVLSCDICACSSTNSALGILPGYKQNFIGMRYQYRSFQSKSHTNSFETNSGSSEVFQTLEFWGKYVPHRRLQIFGFLPLNKFYRIEDQKHQSFKGLGDVSFLALVNVLMSKDSSDKKFKHLLQMGAGIKLPSGEFQMIRDSQMVNRNLQLGTGSYDYPLTIMYTLRHNLFGINAEYNYSINGTNSHKFKFGNRSSSSLRCFYVKNYKNISLVPQVGLNYRHSNPNLIMNTTEAYTESKSALIQAGIDVYYKKLLIGLNSMLPVYENTSEGLVTTRQIMNTHIILLF